MTDKHVMDLVKAMSGDQCFEAVSKEYNQATIPLAHALWSGMQSAVRILDGRPPSKDAVNYFAPPPSVIMVCTPRAYPYSFATSSERYVVLDQHLDRIIHRWTRIIEYSRSTSIDFSPHFNELYAERFYNLGNILMSSRCAAAWQLEEQDGGQFRTLEDPAAELEFRDRSFAQRVFIIGHELAHVMIESLPGDVVQALYDKLYKFHEAGLPDAYPTKPPDSILSASWITRVLEGLTPEAARSKIHDSQGLREECLCDALSIVASVNAGLRWTACLIASIDAIRLLKIIGICDEIGNLFTNGKGEERTDNPGILGAAAVLGDFLLRHLALLWMSNVIRGSIANWGVVTDLKPYIDRFDKAGNAIFESLFKFTPGTSYVDRVNSEDWQGDSLDLAVYEAGHSYARALRFLGFRERPETS